MVLLSQLLGLQFVLWFPQPGLTWRRLWKVRSPKKEDEEDGAGAEGRDEHVSLARRSGPSASRNMQMGPD